MAPPALDTLYVNNRSKRLECQPQSGWSANEKVGSFPKGREGEQLPSRIYQLLGKLS